MKDGTLSKSRAPRAGEHLLRAALMGLLSQGCGATPAAAPEGRVTSSRVVEGGLTAEAFQALCDERGGNVEVLVHCGGLATAAGLAYDTETRTLTEHTCKGVNTCAGWNCVTGP